MSEDVKQFLYSHLGRAGLGVPKYDFTPMTSRGQQRFRCTLRVDDLAYEALGVSTSKKDAAANAAWDFCEFLIREGRMRANELPPRTGRVESSSTDETYVTAGSHEMRSPGNGLDWGSPTSQSTGFSLNRNTNSQHQQQQPQSALQSYVTQRATDVAQSEAVDLRAEIHGGWTMDNCKRALNEFIQKLKLPPVQYKTERKTERTYSAFYELVGVPGHHSFTGNGEGSKKTVAETLCALSIVRQLFHKGLLQACTDGAAKKMGAEKLSPLRVDLHKSLMLRVDELLTAYEIPLAQPEIAEYASTEKPISLLSDLKLEKFPDQPAYTCSSVAWAPPTQNWDVWRNSNIDEGPMATMSLEAISTRLADTERRNPPSQAMLEQRRRLPVIETIDQNSVTLLRGETGCGKSTQVVQYLLEDHLASGRGAHFNAYVLQPRRISAISLAERVSQERGESESGGSVGYSVRFESRIPRPYGAIMFCTVGVLLRRMEGGLRGVSHIFVDEIHERDMDMDFVLIALRDMVRANPKLRVILMSASVDVQLFQNYFGSCPTVEMTARAFPVQQFFLDQIIQDLRFMPEPLEVRRRKFQDEDEEAPPDDAQEDGAVDKTMNMNVCAEDAPSAVKEAMSRLDERLIPFDLIEMILLKVADGNEPGAVLIFLPGWAEIQLMLNRLQEHQEFGDSRKYLLLPLHSQLTSQEQRAVFFRPKEGVRKIILSTNISESAVTIDDVVYVIDSCRSRERFYTSCNNMLHYATVWASRSSMLQRRGRAGRTRPGYCFHLCSKMRYEKGLDEHRQPEMTRSPLQACSLQVKALRLGGISDFLSKAINPPPSEALIESEIVLKELGALGENGELTPLGSLLARLPIDPQWGKTLVLATVLGVGPLMAALAAAVSFTTPFLPPPRFNGQSTGDESAQTTSSGRLGRLCSRHRALAGRRWSDHAALLGALQGFLRAQETHQENDFAGYNYLSVPVLRNTDDARRQLMDLLVNAGNFPPEIMGANYVDLEGDDRRFDLLISLLITAVHPNVCYYRGKRKVYTMEAASALVAKQSILVPPRATDDVLTMLRSPCFVFNEKVRSNVITCRQLSMCTPVQLLIFGARKVEALGPDIVRLDELITLDMDVALAGRLAALRVPLEALLIRSCMTEGGLVERPERELKLIQLLADLSSDELCKGGVPPETDSLLGVALQRQQNPVPEGTYAGPKELYGRGAMGYAPSRSRRGGGFGGSAIAGGFQRGRGGFSRGFGQRAHDDYGRGAEERHDAPQRYGGGGGGNGGGTTQAPGVPDWAMPSSAYHHQRTSGADSSTLSRGGARGRWWQQRRADDNGGGGGGGFHPYRGGFREGGNQQPSGVLRPFRAATDGGNGRGREQQQPQGREQQQPQGWGQHPPWQGSTSTNEDW